jgi:hypothetical protein
MLLRAIPQIGAQVTGDLTPDRDGACSDELRRNALSPLKATLCVSNCAGLEGNARTLTMGLSSSVHRRSPPHSELAQESWRTSSRSAQVKAQQTSTERCHASNQLVELPHFDSDACFAALVVVHSTKLFVAWAM